MGHPVASVFDTIEFRICYAQLRVDDTIALAALMQANAVKLHKPRTQNITFQIIPGGRLTKTAGEPRVTDLTAS